MGKLASLSDLEDGLNHVLDSVKAENYAKSGEGGLTAITGTLKGGEPGVVTMPYDFEEGAAVVYNDEIHILGSGYSNYTSHYKYDGTSWTEVSTLPYNFVSGAAVVYNNEIHILGSSASDSSLPSLRSHYKWDGSSWTSVSTLPIQLSYMFPGTAVVYNDEIHILSGKTTIGDSAHYKWNGTSWSSISVSGGFPRGSAVVYNNEIHFVSGFFGPEHKVYDGTSWRSTTAPPYECHDGSAVVYNNEIHILGGSGNKTAHYKWDGSSWTSVSTLPYNFYCGSAVIYDGEIYLLGGIDNRQACRKWDGTSWNQIVSNGWTSSGGLAYTQTMSAQGVKTNSIVLVGLGTMTMANRDIAIKSKIACISQSENALGFEAADCPEIDIPIVVLKQGGD